jgi:hypothetical protein
MTKEQAIQEQIDEIMDTFDFATAAKVMETYKECGHGYPKDWENEGEFSIYEMRKYARQQLRYAAGYLTTRNQDTIIANGAYFHAAATWGHNEAEGDWVRMSLYFGDSTFNDGTNFTQ